ncbi:MAG: hypothetical protein H7838_06455 [Magnetococcus sp. DMHC-8]
MNGTQTVVMVLQGMSEKFRRKMRTLCWETLDEGVVCFFRLKAYVAQRRHTAGPMSFGGRHALANR